MAILFGKRQDLEDIIREKDKIRIMKTLHFKTNINCSNCVSKVTPFLNKKEGILSWGLDIESPDKLLTVETSDLTAEDIVKTIKRTGFEAEAI